MYTARNIERVWAIGELNQIAKKESVGSNNTYTLLSTSERFVIDLVSEIEQSMYTVDLQFHTFEFIHSNMIRSESKSLNQS